MKARTTLTLPQKSNHVLGVDLQDMKKLDAAIWEIMSDFKKRTIEQLLDTMVTKGYPRHITDRRMDVLFAKKWFDRNGERGNDVKYVLKKHIANPDKETQAVDKKESEIQVVDVKTRLLEQFDAVMQAAGYDATKDPTLPHHVAPHYVVDPTDHVRLAIWKVTQDRQPYTVLDLATLLEHIPVGTLNYHLRTMAVSMFDVTKAEGSKAYVYTMREGVPMPEGLPPYQPNLPAEAKPEDPPAAPQVSEQPEQSNNGDIMNTDTNIHTNDAPLFAMSMTIRGQEFTLQELRAIKEDFKVAGFLKGERSSHCSFFSGRNVQTIGFKVTIKGMDFTIAEIDQLAEQLGKI